MEELLPHPPTLCPQCNKPMVHTAFGDVCMDCNQLVRHEDQTASAPPQPKANLSVDPVPLPPREANQTPEAPAPQESHHIPPKTTLAAPPRTSDPQPITKQDALRYRHRLKARLHRLIVPELPGKLDTTELNSPLSKPELSQKLSAKLPLRPITPSSPHSHVSTPTHQEPSQSKAFVLAEAIAETDIPTMRGSSMTDTKEAKSKLNPALLLGGTVVAILLVALLGFWATQYGQSQSTSRRTTQQSTKPTAPPAAKINVEALKRDATRKTDLSTLATALEVYKRQQGTYPAGNDISVVYPLQYTTPPYISYVNYDPLSDDNTKIKYSYTSDGSSFTIAARLEDPSDPDGQSGYYIVRSK